MYVQYLLGCEVKVTAQHLYWLQALYIREVRVSVYESETRLESPIM